MMTKTPLIPVSLVLALASCLPEGAMDPSLGTEGSMAGSSSGDPVADSADSADTGGACCKEEVFILDAKDAVLTEPMVLGSSLSASTKEIVLSGFFAAGPTPEEGTAVFSFETHCPGIFKLEARVLDFAAGYTASSKVDDPDTFYVSVDGADEILWEYGCQTFVSTWSWLDILPWKGTCSLTGFLDLTVHPAGVHTVTFRSAEARQGTRFAAVAAVGVTFIPAVSCEA